MRVILTERQRSDASHGRVILREARAQRRFTWARHPEGSASAATRDRRIAGPPRAVRAVSDVDLYACNEPDSFPLARKQLPRVESDPSVARRYARASLRMTRPCEASLRSRFPVMTHSTSHRIRVSVVLVAALARTIAAQSAQPNPKSWSLSPPGTPPVTVTDIIGI